MRSLILSLTLLALAISLMLGAAFYLRAACDHMLHVLPSSVEALPSTALEQQISHWEKHTPLYCIIAPHAGVRRVRELLLLLQSCENNRWPEAAAVTLAQLRDTLKQLKKETLAFFPQ